MSDGNSAERVTGIEPAWPAWKAGALPLSYTRVSLTRLEQVYVIDVNVPGPEN